MDEEQFNIACVFPNIAAQIRSSLGTLHLAAAQLAPALERERDPELDAKAALLDQSYYQLLRLVNNLNVAGSLGQEGPLPVRDRDMVEAIQMICDATQSLADLRNIRLEFRCTSAHHVCAFHYFAIEQLVYQLLSNAFKFTPAGGTVRVELKFASRRVLLSVADTGCGIQEDQIPVLFDRYLHDDLLTARPHGLGLGLPICQHIAEGHGGTMMAESRPGKGARFTLSFPDRRGGTLDVSDVKFDYSGGHNQTLLALADALPVQAFSHRNLD